MPIHSTIVDPFKYSLFQELPVHMPKRVASPWVPSPQFCDWAAQKKCCRIGKPYAALSVLT